MMMVRQRAPKFMLDGTATPSARIVRSGVEGDGCILLIPTGARLRVGPSTKGGHHVATTCANDRGHDPGWIGRGDAENLHPVGAPVGCALPALAGPAQRGRGAGLPARLAPGRGGTRHIQDQPVLTLTRMTTPTILKRPSSTVMLRSCRSGRDGRGTPIRLGTKRPG